METETKQLEKASIKKAVEETNPNVQEPTYLTVEERELVDGLNTKRGELEKLISQLGIMEIEKNNLLSEFNALNNIFRKEDGRVFEILKAKYGEFKIGPNGEVFK